MSNILKGFLKPAVAPYTFPETDQLQVEEAPAPPPADGSPVAEAPTAEPPEAPPPEKPAPPPLVADPRTPIDYARLQAEVILEDARKSGEEIRARLRQEAEEELEQLRQAAREEGYGQGYAEGMASANTEARLRQEQQATELERTVQQFLEGASQAREQLLEDAVDELKDLAMVIAEKVIRISLKTSEDIIVRMIRSATEKHKRREWVHIYIAGCDAKGLARITPELTGALAPLSDRVRIIPIADDESGTCIIELPDEIIDASVSTQLANIRAVLNGTPNADLPAGRDAR